MDEHTFLNLVKASRSIRRFCGDYLSLEELEDLIETARFAPSGNNMQVLRFKLVAGKELCDAVFPHLTWARALKDWDGPTERERPRGYIVICAPAGTEKNNVRNMDSGIAAQTLALAAAARGLGACMMVGFDAGLASELDLPADMVVLLVLALGVPAETVILEEADTAHGLSYWREKDGSHHVPKLTVKDLVVGL